MTREGHSHSHESPSNKVHDHPQAYIYTYIHQNAITQSKKVKQTLSIFQEYGLARYRKCKTDIAIPRECGQNKVHER